MAKSRNLPARTALGLAALSILAAAAACTTGDDDAAAKTTPSIVTASRSSSASAHSVVRQTKSVTPEKRISALYSLSADRGTLTPIGNKQFTLTLHATDTYAVWFSDRPARVSGTMATADLVTDWAGFGFVRTPPNVAIVLHDAPREGDTLVAELTHPRYNPSSRTFTAHLRVIDQVDQTDGTMAAHFARTADPSVPTKFSGVSLFVNDVSAQVRNGCLVAPHLTCRS